MKPSVGKSFIAAGVQFFVEFDSLGCADVVDGDILEEFVADKARVRLPMRTGPALISV